MNQLQAFRDTLFYIEMKGRMDYWEQRSKGRQRELRIDHIRDMLRRIEEDPAAFSPAKLGRWLGWAQCAATVAGVLTLEEAKRINKANDEDPQGKITPEMIEAALIDSGLDLFLFTTCDEDDGRPLNVILAEALSKEI